MTNIISYKPVKLTDVPATLYQRKDLQSGLWYVRFWFNDPRRYKTYSTKTNILPDARQFAVLKFAELQILQKNQIPVFTKTIEELGLELIARKQIQADRGDIAAKTAQMWRSKISRFIIPFFGKRQIASISQKDINEYWDWRIDYWLNTSTNDPHLRRHPDLGSRPTGQTLHNETPVLKALFDDAVDHGFMRSDKIPKLPPPVKKTKNRRSALTRKEYAKLLRFIRDGWLVADSRRHILFSRKRMQTLIISTANSGMRPPEFYNLTWDAVRLVKDDYDGFEWTELDVHGKGKQHTIQCTKLVHKRLLEWKDVRKTDFGEKLKDSDYVFSALGNYPAGDLNTSFKRLLTEAKIPLVFQGNKRTMYSLRHTYATIKLSGGVTHTELAENMDTGVDMIKEHYGHVSTPEKARAVIQGRRRFFSR